MILIDHLIILIILKTSLYITSPLPHRQTSYGEETQVFLIFVIACTCNVNVMRFISIIVLCANKFRGHDVIIRRFSAVIWLITITVFFLSNLLCFTINKKKNRPNKRLLFLFFPAQPKSKYLREKRTFKKHFFFLSGNCVL